MGSRFVEPGGRRTQTKIFILHLDDSEDLPVGAAARQTTALMPGEGAIDLQRILSTLKRLGYDSLVSIELFRPEYWDWPDEQTIQVCYEKTRETIAPLLPIG
jgi:2-keto-myo-inositol isomerase